MSHIKSLDNEILELLYNNKMDLRDSDYFNEKIDGQDGYHFDLSVELFQFDKYINKNNSNFESAM